MNVWAWMDRRRIGGMRIWEFSFNSLFQEYGRLFLWHVVLRHPILTAKGLARYQKKVRTSRLHPKPISNQIYGEKRSIVGVGFCLKPLHPACPSGRFNHDCCYFDKCLYNHSSQVPPSCETCSIRTIGTHALKTGQHFYIMTSAKDILYDLLLPAIWKRQFNSGTFVICRYSFDAFEAALLIAGIDGRLYEFESGDCRDYCTWLLADEGIKMEQTVVNCQVYKQLCHQMREADAKCLDEVVFEKRGNIFLVMKGCA